MTWIIAAYFAIGGVVALCYLSLLREPPEYDADWEHMRSMMKGGPLYSGLSMFLICVLAWPLIFIRRSS